MVGAELVEERDHEPAQLVAALRIGFLPHLGEVREADDPEQRDELRRLMVALFDELGPEHPLSTRFRRQLAAALF